MLLYIYILCALQSDEIGLINHQTTHSVKNAKNSFILCTVVSTYPLSPSLSLSRSLSLSLSVSLSLSLIH